MRIHRRHIPTGRLTIRALLVTRPYLDPADLQALQQHWADDDAVEVRANEPDLKPWMRVADGSDMRSANPGCLIVRSTNLVVADRSYIEACQLAMCRGTVLADVGGCGHYLATSMERPIRAYPARCAQDPGPTGSVARLVRIHRRDHRRRTSSARRMLIIAPGHVTVRYDGHTGPHLIDLHTPTTGPDTRYEIARKTRHTRRCRSRDVGGAARRRDR